MPRVLNKSLPATLICQQRARHVASSYIKSLVEHVMLTRRCAIVYIEQLIAHASDRGVTRRKFKQSLDAFKRLLAHRSVLPLKLKNYSINVRSPFSGDNLAVSIGETWPISWTQVYQSVREQLKAPRSASLLLWFEIDGSLYLPHDSIVARTERYITREQAKRTLIWQIKPNIQLVHRTCCDPEWDGWFCRTCYRRVGEI